MNLEFVDPQLRSALRRAALAEHSPGAGREHPVG